MALRNFVVALCLSGAPAIATNPVGDEPGAAPPGTAETRYCMRVEPVTGSRIETIECWTRAQWAEQGVDVDAEWAKEGVAVKG